MFILRQWQDKIIWVTGDGKQIENRTVSNFTGHNSYIKRHRETNQTKIKFDTTSAQENCRKN